MGCTASSVTEAVRALDANKTRVQYRIRLQNAEPRYSEPVRVVLLSVKALLMAEASVRMDANAAKPMKAATRAYWIRP